jgi:IstB-like ATP binding protein
MGASLAIPKPARAEIVTIGETLLGVGPRSAAGRWGVGARICLPRPAGWYIGQRYRADADDRAGHRCDRGDSWLNQGANTLLFGPPGGGKPHLAAALGLALVQQRRRAQFILPKPMNSGVS